MILIVSTSGDLHSRAIVREFHNRNFVDYRVLSSDDISGSRSITIAQKSSSLNVRLGASRGSDSLSLEDIGVVWWLNRPGIAGGSNS